MYNGNFLRAIASSIGALVGATIVADYVQMRLQTANQHTYLQGVHDTLASLGEIRPANVRTLPARHHVNGFGTVNQR